MLTVANIHYNFGGKKMNWKNICLCLIFSCNKKVCGEKAISLFLAIFSKQQQLKLSGREAVKGFKEPPLPKQVNTVAQYC